MMPDMWQKLARHPLVRGLLDLAFPPYCAVCGALGAWLCDDCVAEMLDLGLAHPPQQISLPGIATLASAAPHVGPARRVVHQLKYNGLRVLAAPMAALMLTAQPALVAQADLIAPAPLHVNRVRRRGYNQAALLAQALGDLAQIAVAPELLVRTRDTRSQVGLTRAERLANVGDAFVAQTRAAGACILLIDDVCTTGATLSACAVALKLAGARRVLALTFAQAREGHAHHGSMILAP